MLDRLSTIIVAAIATFLVIGFITGLAWSISTGFAGFWGGLPFWVIALSVLALALYDFWEETIRKDKSDRKAGGKTGGKTGGG